MKLEEEIEKFFNKKYLKYFNEIKKQNDFKKSVYYFYYYFKWVEWDEEDVKNNGTKEEFYADLKKKMKKIKFIAYCSSKNKEIKEKNIKQLSRITKNIHEFINREKGIKKILKEKSLNEKKVILDKMILYIFLMCEIISHYEHFISNDAKVFALHFCRNFFENYKYCFKDMNNKEIISINDYYKYRRYFDEKHDTIMNFFSEKEEDFGNFFPNEFYYLFFENKIKMEQKILKTEKICGICLNEYNTDMISYCEIHYICLECYEETDIEVCINKCLKKELILYKKA